MTRLGVLQPRGPKCNVTVAPRISGDASSTGAITLIDGLGVRPIDEVSAFAAVGGDGVPVVLSDFGFDDGELNLVPQGIHILKVGGTIDEMHFDFLRGRTVFPAFFEPNSFENRPMDPHLHFYRIAIQFT